MKLIFDSNVFDELLTGILDIEKVRNKAGEFYITHVQVDELNACIYKEKRAKLFNIMVEVRPQKIPTESFVLDTSRLGHAKLSDGSLLEKLSLGNYKKTNDALIGETAIKNDLTLITNDKKLKNKIIDLEVRQSQSVN